MPEKRAHIWNGYGPRLTFADSFYCAKNAVICSRSRQDAACITRSALLINKRAGQSLLRQLYHGYM
jgi:hypothetical protein